MIFPEVMFYAEANGLLPTRAGKINAIINEIKLYPHPEMKFEDFEKVLNNYGLCYKDLTRMEINYINASIR